MDCISLCSDPEKQVPLDNLVPTAMSSWVLLEPLGAQIRRTHLLSTLAPQVSPGPKDIFAASTLMNHVCVYMYPDALPFSTTLTSPASLAQELFFLPEMALSTASLEVSQLFVHSILRPELCFDSVAITHK